jgi:hypothetical protein
VLVVLRIAHQGHLRAPLPDGAELHAETVGRIDGAAAAAAVREAARAGSLHLYALREESLCLSSRSEVYSSPDNSLTAKSRVPL